MDPNAWGFLSQGSDLGRISTQAHWMVAFFQQDSVLSRFHWPKWQTSWSWKHTGTDSESFVEIWCAHTVETPDLTAIQQSGLNTNKYVIIMSLCTLNSWSGCDSVSRFVFYLFVHHTSLYIWNVGACGDIFAAACYWAMNVDLYDSIISRKMYLRSKNVVKPRASSRRSPALERV